MPSIAMIKEISGERTRQKSSFIADQMERLMVALCAFASIWHTRHAINSGNAIQDRL
jgi:hypothetical protein